MKTPTMEIRPGGGETANGSACEALLTEARRLCRSEPEKAVLLVREAVQTALHHRDLRLYARTLLVGADVSLVLTDYSDMEHYLEEAVDCFTRLHDCAGKAGALRRLGICHTEMQRSTEARRCLEQAVALWSTLGNTVELASAYNALGVCLCRAGEYDCALNYHFQSLALCEQAGDERAVAALHNNIAAVYMGLHDYTRALHSFEQSLEVRRALQDKVGTAGTLENIGAVLLELRRPAEALSSLRKALPLWRELRAPHHLAVTLANIGVACEQLDDAPQALVFCNEALATARDINHDALEADILICMGRAYCRMGNTTCALKVLTQALDTAVACDLRVAQAGLHAQLADVYAAEGEYPQAFRHQVLSAALYERLVGPGVQRAVADREARYLQCRAEKEKEDVRRRAESAERELQSRTRELHEATLTLLQWAHAQRLLRADAGEVVHTKECNPAQRTSVAVPPQEPVPLFEQQFERTYARVIAELRRRCTHLTPMELRICILLKLGLLSKQIGEVLCIAEETVKTHRKHIRKKMGLRKNDNLATLMLDL